MPIGELIALISLSMTLLGCFVTMLVYMYRVGSLVSTMSAALANHSKWEANVQLVPLLLKDMEQVKDTLNGISGKVSDFPRMREKLESIVDSVEELKDLRIDSRLSVIEQVHRRMTPATMPRTIIPRNDGDK